MEKKRNGQTIAIIALAIALLVMSVGYASFARDLEINGTATIGSSTWDIHFDDQSYSESSGSVAASSKSITNTTMLYNVTLSKPGDFYEFTINVENTGDFDALLDSITISTLSEAQSKYLSHKVTYGTDEYTTTTTGLSKELVKTSGTESVKVRVEYLVPANEADLPTSGAADIKLDVTLSYIQKTS